MFKAEVEKVEEIKKKDVIVKKDTQVIDKAEHFTLPANYKIN